VIVHAIVNKALTEWSWPGQDCRQRGMRDPDDVGTA